MSLDAGCPTLAISSCPDHQPSESTVSFVFSPGCRQTFSISLLCLRTLDSFEVLEFTIFYLGMGGLGRESPFFKKKHFQIIRGNLFRKFLK